MTTRNDIVSPSTTARETPGASPASHGTGNRDAAAGGAHTAGGDIHPAGTTTHGAPRPGGRCTVGRFAPTPSGRMHLGNAFAALMAWAAAKSEGGTCILRIEDLDPRAHDPRATAALVGDLAWLGLTFDGTTTYQHERADLYAMAEATLSAAGRTYPCFCTRAELHAATAPHASDGTRRYPGTCRGLSAAEIERRLLGGRTPALRVAVPDADDPAGTITIRDAVYGTHRDVLASTCGDFVIRRSDGVYAYQLAVVVDDGDAGVTQVVRGRDLLGSAARQAWLAATLGLAVPAYAHIPLLVGKGGARLAKRDGATDLGTLREQGYAASEIIGALAHGVGLAARHERVSATQLAERFTWNAVRAHRHDIVVGDDFLP